MKFSMIVTCAFFLTLTACAAPEPGPAATQVQEIGTFEPQPFAADGTETELSSESESAPPALPALQLVTLGEEGDRLSARPADPLSLVDLPGYQSIDFGHHYTHALSPDGRTMALITWPNGMDNKGGVLHLIELPAWTYHVTDVNFDQFIGALLFSPDGKQLYWSEPARTDPAHGMPRDYKIYRYDLDSQVRTEVLQFPPSFAPWEMHLLNADSRLAIYGLPTTPDFLAEDVPHVLLFDLDAGLEASDVRLEGVTAGQMRVDTGGANESPYRMYLPDLAWDLERSLLYLVHADSDRITVVDLAQGEVRRQSDIQPAQSLLERLLGWLSTPAQAKAVPGTEKKAVLSPNGDRLYVVGLRSEMERKEDSQEWDWRQDPLSVQVIATDDLTELQRLDLPVNDLALSPDGNWLLLTGAYDVTGTEGQLERVAGGLYLLNTHTLQVAVHLLPESEVYLHGFSADDRYEYVSTAASEWLDDHWGNWRVKLHLLELESGHFLAEREFTGYVLDVIR
ncbi:MAG TPA: hypothetical protein VGA03_09855 [Anaerolineales bacterium]